MANEKRNLIDQDLLIDSLGASDMEIFAKEVISEAPTVDAVEVVHGRWIVDAVEVDHPFLEFESVWRDVHQCSICKEYFDVSDARNYCPNCGAKMDTPLGNISVRCRRMIARMNCSVNSRALWAITCTCLN